MPGAGELSVRERLVEAADEVISRDGVDAASIGAVASAAGIARSTAFRQLGTRDDMLVEVAVLRAKAYAEECVVRMGSHHGAATQLEIAFHYFVAKLPDDPLMMAFLDVSTVDDINTDVRELISYTFGPVIEGGRTQGWLRTDMSDATIERWLVEQLYLGLKQADRSRSAVRARVRDFLIPALTATVATGDLGRADVVARLAVALEHALRLVDSLRSGVDEEAPISRDPGGS